MKKIFFIVILVVAFTFVSAKGAKLHFGFLNPKGAEASFIFGGGQRIQVDEMISINFMGQYYYKNFSEERKINSGISDAGNDFDTIQKSADISTFYIPFGANIEIGFPVSRAVKPYVGVGVGYGFLWEDVFVAAYETENGEENKIDDIDFFSGFNWEVSTGCSLPLGSRSEIFTELFYNGAKLKRDFKETEFGTTWDEIDMSGIGVRAGISFSL